nr:MAG TPA: hypothetical protein [Caudoviricetes sp.]
MRGSQIGYLSLKPKNNNKKNITTVDSPNCLTDFEKNLSRRLIAKQCENKFETYRTVNISFKTYKISLSRNNTSY